MLLTAQKVLSLASGETGTNVYGYSHRNAESLQGIDWGSPDVTTIADRHPGRLMLALRHVEGSGNRVLSYLDVAFGDQLPLQEVERLLQKATTHWRRGFPVWREETMGLRFYTSSRDPEDASELRALKDSIVVAFSGPSAKSNGTSPIQAHPPQPLRVLRLRGKASFRFELDSPSRDFLRKTRPELVLPRAMNVTYENEGDLRDFVSVPIESIAAEALTDLDLGQLDALAGILVLDGESGGTLWRSSGAPET